MRTSQGSELTSSADASDVNQRSDGTTSGSNGAAPPEPDERPTSRAEVPPLGARPGFWPVMGYAALLGLVIAFGSLVFLALVKGGTTLWYTEPKNSGWLDGHLWWVAVTAGAGLLVGVLRRVFRLPLVEPGVIKEVKAGRVEPATVLQAVAVSLVGLAGGASLGPEAALGKMGGGLGAWVSKRRQLSDEMRETNTFSGMSGAYGSLLSAPYIAVLGILEIARPKAGRYSETLFAGLLSASIAFAVYFPIAGSTFVGLFRVPSFKYEDWQLAAAIPLGLLAAVLALITVIALGLMKKLTAPLAKYTILRPLVGGTVFGLVAVALPLTIFTGTDQLKTVLHNGPALGAGFLIAVVFAKIFVFSLCPNTGFIGGPFFPMLFVGGTAGVVVHELIPGVPLALAFATMLAAVPGALVAAPFAMLLLGVLITQIGTVQSAPVAVGVLTAYLALTGSGLLLELMQKAKGAPAREPGGHTARGTAKAA